MADVLFYVQHLLGIGHLRRAAALVSAMDRAGLEVVLASGGLPVAGLDIGGARLVQLPPLRSRDAAFSALVDGDGNAIDDAWKAARRDRLLALYRETRPRAIVIEQFPFGRRQLRFELMPLLEAAAASDPRPAVLASVRDIVNQPGKPEKTAWILDTARRRFELVLVHGDPAFATFEESFPPAARIAERIRYTGYVVGDAPSDRDGPLDRDGPGQGEVLVSTGGGAVAAPLVEAALAARPRSPLKDATWRILIGDNLPQETFARHAAAAAEDVIVERSRADFRARLARCALSISQAGYNTAIEVLCAGVPAVLVPFAGSGETEQSLRARLLAERGAAVALPEAELTGESLAEAVAKALQSKGRRPRVALATEGAARTAEIVRERLAIVGG